MTEQSILGPTVEIRGICRYTPERARRGYRLTLFLTSMRELDNRTAFSRDPEAYMASRGLSEHERDMIRRRAYAELLDYGASNVAIGKASHALGTNLVERGAQGRGQTAEQFLAERRAANRGQPWHF